MEIHHISQRRFAHTIGWALAISITIIVLVALMGRAAVNFEAALTKPDLAVYFLLQDDEIGRTTVLFESADQREYLAEAKSGPMFVKLKRKDSGEWFVAEKEPLH